jgi:hypothetical protein
MGPVADQMLKQFVANFAARLQALQTQQTAASAEAAGPTAGTGTSAATASASATATAATSEAALPHSELNGLALAWAIVRDWLRGLFSRKTA